MVDPDTSDRARDVHGKLTNNGKRGFIIKTYGQLLELDYEACYKKEDKNSKELVKCYAEKVYMPIGKSLELVFGDRPSPGFICGIREAVVAGGKPLPGSCCLDTPYELDGVNWMGTYCKLSYCTGRLGTLFCACFLF
jgi:hypothetical protein